MTDPAPSDAVEDLDIDFDQIRREADMLRFRTLAALFARLGSWLKAFFNGHGPLGTPTHG